MPKGSVNLQADLTFQRELWDAAVRLRGTVAPADYKHYVLPLLFLRYLSLRFEQRQAEIRALQENPESDYYTGDADQDSATLADPAEYESHNIFIVPEESSWEYLRAEARADDIKIKIDTAMRLLEEAHPYWGT